MQPIFLSFASGVAYRKIVKRHFRSISSIDQLVSISNYSTKVAKLLFLTAGNKSYCGTLQRLTDSQQSTTEPIPIPVSSPKRQVSQRKPFALSSTPAQTSSRLRTHGTSVPSRPQKLPGALIRTTSAPPMRPRHTPDAPQPHPRCASPSAPTLPPHPKVVYNSRTGVTQRHEAIRTSKTLRGNCMRNCRTPRRPLSKSHVIPPGPHSSTAQKPRNINDPISKPETSSRELRAKLLRLRSQGQGTHAYARPEAAEPRLQHIRIGNKHPDR